MDCFNKEERVRQKQFAELRDRLFAPLVDLLVTNKVTPNWVSLAGVIALLILCFLPPAFPILATFFMALYVLCDGIDGPLARRLDIAHTGGSLMDIVADQLGVVFLAAAAIHHLGAWGPVMVIFVSAYLLFIALAIYANTIEVQRRRVLRCKYLFFLLYLGSLFTHQDMVTLFSSVFCLYYSVEIFILLQRIYAFHNKKFLAERDATDQG